MACSKASDRTAPEVVRSRRARRAGGAPLSAEAGETLIELLVTIILMGVGAVAILTSLLVSSTTAHVNEQKTQMSLYLQRWAETTIAPNLTTTGVVVWRDCKIIPGPPAFEPDQAGWSAPDPTIEQLKMPVDDWNHPDFTPASSECSTPGDPKLQKQVLRVTLTVRTAPGRDQLVDSLVLYKRNPTCPKGLLPDGEASYNNADLGPC